MNTTVAPVEIIITDANVLIYLYIVGELNSLLRLGIPVVIPDMVRLELVRTPPFTAVVEVAQWLRDNEPDTVRVASTEVFEQYVRLLLVDPSAKSLGRGEQAAGEALYQRIERGLHGAILLYGDESVPRRDQFVRPIPDFIVPLGVSNYRRGANALCVPLDGQAILPWAHSLADSLP